MDNFSTASGSQSSPDAGEYFGLQPEQTWGPYRIVRLLGKGGMGEVYEAEHVESGRRLALKTLRQSVARPLDRERFMREGRIAASINHPNSVYIYGTEEIAGTPVIAMELVSGGSLKDRVDQRGPMPPAEAVDAILQVISGLEAAAGVGVLHRDIKPSNLFVDADDTVKIGDFGLSVSTLTLETQLTTTGTIMGTPMFAPPEQLRGDELDVRSDIYSVGASLYFLITDKPPFDAREPVKLIAAVLQDVPRSPKTIAPETSAGLAKVVMRCLEKQALARFQSYSELRAALMPFSTTAPVPAPLGLRLIASLIDSIPFATIGTMIGASLTAARNAGPFLNFPYQQLLFASSALYYACCEGFFGAGIGKALCGIRVIHSAGGRPGFLRALIRVSIFQGGTWIGIAVIATSPHSDLMTATLLEWLAIANLGLLFALARRDNGFAAIHDRFSGTRVVMRLRVQTSLVVQNETVVSSEIQTGPRIGPYTVIESLTKTGAAEVLLGYDPKLRRRVWIHSLAAGIAGVPQPFRDLKRSTRARWLSGKRTPAESWDAYGAVEGKPLAELLKAKQGWSSIRRWLLDISEEVRQSQADGISIREISPDRIWITSEGRARLLEFAPGKSADAGRNILNVGDWPAVQDSLYRLAVSGLEGRQAALAEATVDLPAVPLPLRARQLLSDLKGKHIESFDQFVSALRFLNESEAVVSSRRRAGNIVCVGAIFLSFAASAAVVGLARTRDHFNNPDAERLIACLRQFETSTSAEEKATLETYIASHFRKVFQDRSRWSSAMQVIQIRQPHFFDKARQIFDSTRVPDKAEAASADAKLQPFLTDIDRTFEKTVGFGAIVPVLGMTMMFGALMNFAAMVIALVCRGRGLMTAFGIAIVNADGTAITRTRALFRTFIASSPALLALAGVFRVFGSLQFRRFVSSPSLSGFATATGASDDALANICIVMGFVLMVVGAILAVRNPERGLQDRIAGTALVPR